MYEKFFHLRERPFALSPDPDYLFPSRVHQEALSYLRYGIEGHAGFVVVTGEIGSGKTTLLQTVLGRLDGSTVVSRIVNTMLEPRELLEAIMLDFGMDPTGRSKPVMVRAIADYLVAQRNGGRLVLLVIDEAQNLSLPALEELRMLSNLETEKSKLIQIVLVGQPDLRHKLSSPQLEQLRQRVTVSYHLNPLGADETYAYINHRLTRAATAAPPEFPREATDLIHARTGGVPRTINVIADATLLTAYGVDAKVITRAIVAETIEELDVTGVLAPAKVEGRAAASPARVPTAGVAVTDDAAAREQAFASRERDLRAREEMLAARQRALEEEARRAREPHVAVAARVTPAAADTTGRPESVPATAAPARPAVTIGTPAASRLGATAQPGAMARPPVTPARAAVQPRGTVVRPATVPARPAAATPRAAATSARPTPVTPTTPPWPPTRPATVSRSSATIFADWGRPQASIWTRLWRFLVGAPEAEGY